MDPLRVMEGAGAFIGIIAAGLIVVSGGKVHNMTTAVHMWLAAMIGIACGAGQWPLVAVAVLVGVVMMTLLRLAEKRWLDAWHARRKVRDED
jgi:putative Mg2+ transporter-C (MgtC) family protein